MNELTLKLLDLLVFILLSTYLTICFVEIIIVRAIQARRRIQEALDGKDDEAEETDGQ